MWIGTTSSGMPCKSEEDIKYAIDGAALEISFVNSYFDFNDYETPIKDYLDDRVYNSILKGYSRGNDIFVRKNTSSRRDSIYSYTTDSVTDIFTCMLILYLKYQKQRTLFYRLFDYYYNIITQSRFKINIQKILYFN